MPTDNYIRAEDKARWGFGGDASNITVGVGSKDDGERSLDVKSAEGEGGRNNGGGEDPLADKTVNQLKEYAANATPPIDLGDATKKADIIAAIQLAEGN